MRAFEIHTFHNGKWKIDSVFDDRDLALFEASRMDSSSRYAGVRVIEENFDEDSRECKTRTIYRGARNGQTMLPPKKNAGQGGKQGTAAKSAGKEQNRKKGAVKNKQKKKKGFGFTIMVLTLALFGAAAAIVGLRMLARYL